MISEHWVIEQIPVFDGVTDFYYNNTYWPYGLCSVYANVIVKFFEEAEKRFWKKKSGRNKSLKYKEKQRIQKSDRMCNKAVLCQPSLDILSIVSKNYPSLLCVFCKYKNRMPLIKYKKQEMINEITNEIIFILPDNLHYIIVEYERNKNNE